MESPTAGVNEQEVGTKLIALQLLFNMRSLGMALKLVAEEDTTKPTLYWEKSFQNREGVWGRSGEAFPKSAGRSGEVLEIIWRTNLMTNFGKDAPFEFWIGRNTIPRPFPSKVCLLQ